MKIKTVLTALIFFGFLFFFLTCTSYALASPKLYLEPVSQELTNGQNFELQIKIDTESTQTVGSDAIINFQADKLTVGNVTNGGFYSDFYYSVGNGRIEIHSFLKTLYDSKTGSGTLAKIILTAKTGTGTSDITINCGSNPTSTIVDLSGNNVISCGSLNKTTITFKTDTQATTTQTPAPTYGEPNYCGGTCGSNYNCQEGFYCYNGYCRNPNCSEDTDCVCTTSAPASNNLPGALTTTAKSKTKTQTPKPTIKSTASPLVITLETYSGQNPLEKAYEQEAAEEEAYETPQPKFQFGKILPYLAGLILISIITFVIIKKRNKKLTMPDVNPEPIQNESLTYKPEPPFLAQTQQIPPPQENQTETGNNNPPNTPLT